MANEMTYGLAWYYKAQWDKIRAISADRSHMDEKFEDWESNAFAMVSKLEADGKKVHRVYIDADMLLAWCTRKGIPIDGHARSLYTNHLMASHFGRADDI